jgi:hypothetical protein
MKLVNFSQGWFAMAEYMEQLAKRNYSGFPFCPNSQQLCAPSPWKTSYFPPFFAEMGASAG